MIISKQHPGKMIKNLGLMALVVLALSGCQLSSPYERLVKEELAKGIRQDSLFLDIHFGMSSKDFYAHCWELNKQQLIQQGPSNLSVQYEPEGFRGPVRMNFYPTFNPEGKIYEMPITFAYKTWAPWNKQYWSDSLIVDVLDQMTEWYGGEFLRMEHPEKGVAYVKVDGNRRIIVHRKDDQFVKVLMSDLLATDTLDTRSLTQK